MIEALEGMAATQRAVQAEKVTYRSLEEYNDQLFGNGPVSAFISDQVPGAISLEKLLEGLAEQASEPVSWVDMAGGYAVAMRQVSELNALGTIGELSLTSVDVVDWDIEGLAPDPDLQRHAKGFDIKDPLFAPNSVRSNVETVSLAQPANLITCVMAIQYLNNPLQALTNWYNQLRSGGLMLVTTGNYSWSRQITQDDGAPGQPIKGFVEELESAAIEFQESFDLHHGTLGPHRLGSPYDFGRLAIKKKPGTSLALKTSVDSVSLIPSIDPSGTNEGYLHVVYKKVDAPIAVVGATS